MSVTNVISLGCPLPLTVATVNNVQTLKEKEEALAIERRNFGKTEAQIRREKVELDLRDQEKNDRGSGRRVRGGYYSKGANR
jgi:hypothetical protein